jgi:hypothetical protein
MKISSSGKDKLMERNFSLEKRSEKTTRSTGKTGLPPWYQQYTYQEEPTDNQRPLHGDPRDKHDNDFIPSDDDSDHGYGHPGVGIGPTTDLSARASSASELGTLAGGPCVSTHKVHRNKPQEMNEAFKTLANTINKQEREALNKYKANNDHGAYDKSRSKIVNYTRGEFKRIMNS